MCVLNHRLNHIHLSTTVESDFYSMDCRKVLSLSRRQEVLLTNKWEKKKKFGQNRFKVPICLYRYTCMNISVYMHIHINVQSSRHNNKSLCLIKIVVLSTVEGNNIQGNWGVPFSVPKVSLKSRVRIIECIHHMGFPVLSKHTKMH